MKTNEVINQIINDCNNSIVDVNSYSNEKLCDIYLDDERDDSKNNCLECPVYFVTGDVECLLNVDIRNFIKHRDKEHNSQDKKEPCDKCKELKKKEGVFYREVLRKYNKNTGSIQNFFNKRNNILIKKNITDLELILSGTGSLTDTGAGLLTGVGLRKNIYHNHLCCYFGDWVSGYCLNCPIKIKTNIKYCHNAPLHELVKHLDFKSKDNKEGVEYGMTHPGCKICNTAIEKQIVFLKNFLTKQEKKEVQDENK